MLGTIFTYIIVIDFFLFVFFLSIFDIRKLNNNQRLLPFVQVFGALSIFGFFFIVATFGEISRGESILPWSQLLAYIHFDEYGFTNAFHSLLTKASLLIVIFILPSKMYVEKIYYKTNKVVFFPYVINFFIGLYLCSPENFIYR